MTSASVGATPATSQAAGAQSATAVRIPSPAWSSLLYAVVTASTRARRPVTRSSAVTTIASAPVTGGTQSNRPSGAATSGASRYSPIVIGARYTAPGLSPAQARWATTRL